MLLVMVVGLVGVQGKSTVATPDSSSGQDDGSVANKPTPATAVKVDQQTVVATGKAQRPNSLQVQDKFARKLIVGR